MKAFVFFVILAGCSTSQKSIVGPDGTKHKLITCNIVDSCYKKAHDLCGKYTIVNSSTEGAGDAKVVKLLVKCDEDKPVEEKVTPAEEIKAEEKVTEE